MLIMDFPFLITLEDENFDDDEHRALRRVAKLRTVTGHGHVSVPSLCFVCALSRLSQVGFHKTSHCSCSL